MRTLLLILMFVLSSVAHSQETKKDTSWKAGGFFGLNFSQTALSNWQGGGQDNITLTSIFNYEINYKKGKNEWNNKLDCQYGLANTGGSKSWRKNTDQILAISKFSIKAFKKRWFYSTMGDFRSQFSPGYQYNDTGKTIVSNFMAPAYVQLALGLDYKIEDYFTATFSPLAGKITIVNNTDLANAGAYGVQAAVRDTAGNVITPGQKIRYEFGGRFTLKFKKDITKNVTVDSYLDFFSNYFHNPQNVDIVWNNLVTFKISKWFTASVSTKLIYDDDIIVKRDWNKDGAYDNKNDINGPRAQWLTNIGIGLGYRF